MISLPHHLRNQASRLIAIALIFALYGLTRLPELSTAERRELAGQIHFKKLSLPEIAGPEMRSFRPVNPSLEHIAGWISSLGAAVSLNDLDGDGLPNDICYVDTRTDQVIVAPVPGTAPRYQPFVLDPGPELFDRNTMAPMGCLPGDLNEDGLMDVIIYYWGRTPLAFLKVDGTSKPSLNSSSYRVQEIVPGGERWYTNAATLADLDGDGHADLIIGNYFEDGARILDAKARDADHMQHSMSRAFNGGHNYLLRWESAANGAGSSVRYEVMSGSIEGDEDGRFSNGWTLAVGAADLDGDLLPEIYFANDFGPDCLLHNRSTPGRFHFAPLEGTKTLTTPNSKVLGRDSFKGMGVDFADLNGDGVPDIFVSNLAEEHALEESHFAFISAGRTEAMKRGIAPYTDNSESLGLSRSGWGWDIKLGDFNNDGQLEIMQATGFLNGEVNRWPELHELAMGNDQLLQHPAVWPRFMAGNDCLSCHDHTPFFMLARDGRYYDVAPELGLDTAQVSRGIATADVDGDGLLDFAIANQWSASYFYHNESFRAGAFLGLHLRLPVNQASGATTVVSPGHPSHGFLSRAAIGAQAIVSLPDGRKLVAQVDGGNGHSGKRTQDIQFGLGAVAPNQKLSVLLTWRDAKGKVRRQSLQLMPGWYTVILGQTEGEKDERA
jgi:hypothetical protein